CSAGSRTGDVADVKRCEPPQRARVGESIPRVGEYGKERSPDESGSYPCGDRNEQRTTEWYSHCRQLAASMASSTVRRVSASSWPGAELSPTAAKVATEPNVAAAMREITPKGPMAMLTRAWSG